MLCWQIVNAFVLSLGNRNHSSFFPLPYTNLEKRCQGEWVIWLMNAFFSNFFLNHGSIYTSDRKHKYSGNKTLSSLCKIRKELFCKVKPKALCFSCFPLYWISPGALDLGGGCENTLCRGCLGGLGFQVKNECLSSCLMS